MAAATKQNLEGKVCVVTGASSGIGLAISKALSKEGAQVIMCSRTITEENSTGIGIAVACNVVSREAVTSMVSDVILRFGKIDLLVNAAGVRC
jgi:3-oxoacyl-[acyl-carrier protein] reductase